MRHLIAMMLVVPFLMACEGTRVLPAPPADKAEIVQVPGFPGVRSWGDAPPEESQARLRAMRRLISERIRAGVELPNGGEVDVLLLSGGGSDGAYGAGLLAGWTDRGNRPEFWVVTGISTGALIAPFVFAGSEFDAELERFYTNTKTEDLVTFRVFDALRGTFLGLTDARALSKTVEEALTPALLKRIGEEHARGRRLLVGTTNLDAQRPVVWDVGRIAATGKPGARQLIRDILLASAAIPGAMAPVQIAVEADGQRFAEMHVDGGVTRQLFFLPPSLRLRSIRNLFGPDFRIGTIYLLRNTKLAPDYAETGAGIVPITSRSISTMIKFSGVANVRNIETQARQNGFKLKVTAVPESFSHPEEEMFDPIYMRALFQVGYDAIVDGDPWEVLIGPEAPNG